MPASIPTHNRGKHSADMLPWDTAAIQQQTQGRRSEASLRAAERLLEKSGLLPEPMDFERLRDELDRPLKSAVTDHLLAAARRRRDAVLMLQLHRNKDGPWVLFANDARRGRRWIWGEGAAPGADFVRAALAAFVRHAGKDVLFFPHGELCAWCRELADHGRQHAVVETQVGTGVLALAAYPERVTGTRARSRTGYRQPYAARPRHLECLEAESIHIMREVAAQTERPVMLYSMGKDSSVMLHLARKAFAPAPPPFPLLHVDTGWNFQAVHQFRDALAEEGAMEVLVHINPAGLKQHINPFDHGARLHTHIMKTQGLCQALNQHGFDAALGGARRDEEKSRAKERIFSFRDASQRWDPTQQRPELWTLYNARRHSGESMRVFPLSNWTELEVWQYIYCEQIPVVPLYFAAERPVVERGGLLILVDDERLRLQPGEQVRIRKVRFRSLGCYPLSGAIASDADSLPAILLELQRDRGGERQGRAIDSAAAAMENQKIEGYF